MLTTSAASVLFFNAARSQHQQQLLQQKSEWEKKFLCKVSSVVSCTHSCALAFRLTQWMAFDPNNFSTPLLRQYNKIFFDVGQTWPLFVFIFVLFTIFNYNIVQSLTINVKSIDGVLGIWTRDHRTVRADESTELWRPTWLFFNRATPTIDKKTKQPFR